MSNTTNAISTREMLRIIGKALCEDAEARKAATEETDPVWGKLLSYAMLSIRHVFFANESKGVSIKDVHFASGKVVKEYPKQCFAFNKSYYNEMKERIPKANPDIAQEGNKWLKDNLFLVEDYEENKSLITDCCLSLNWLGDHLTIGDHESFINKRQYERIIKQAEEWAGN